jgi:hypothetical protein
MTMLLIAVAMLIAVVVTPIRAIVFVKGRQYWASRWRAAKRWRKSFAVTGWVFMAIAVCEWLAVVVLIVMKFHDRRFLGGSGQAALGFFIVLAVIGFTMFLALVVGELMTLPLRFTPLEDAPHGQAAATRAGSTFPAGPRSL